MNGKICNKSSQGCSFLRFPDLHSPPAQKPPHSSPSWTHLYTGTHPWGWPAHQQSSARRSPAALHTRGPLPVPPSGGTWAPCCSEGWGSWSCDPYPGSWRIRLSEAPRGAWRSVVAVPACALCHHHHRCCCSSVASQQSARLLPFKGGTGGQLAPELTKLPWYLDGWETGNHGWKWCV